MELYEQISASIPKPIIGMAAGAAFGFVYDWWITRQHGSQGEILFVGGGALALGYAAFRFL